MLNDVLLEDSRIPPWGLRPVDAAERNCTPVPSAAYPLLPDGTFRYWDEYSFALPAGADGPTYDGDISAGVSLAGAAKRALERVSK